MAGATDQRDESSRIGIARATLWLSIGNISSRLLGLVREILLVNLFGATPLAEALRIAIIIPRTLYDLLAAGYVNGAFVPVFGSVDQNEGRVSLHQLVISLLSLVGLILAIFVIAIEVLAEPLVNLVAPAASTETTEIASQLLRITAPGLFFFGAFAILSGTLLAIRLFFWPAFAITIFNGTVVVFLLTIALGFETFPSEKIRLAALAWMIASVLMMVFQLPGLRRAGWRYERPRAHPQLRRIAQLCLPILLTLLLDTLVTRLFTYRLANQSGPGSINYLELGTTIIQFPQGLVAAAISLAILPTLARHASNPEPTAQEAFTATLNRGLRLATTLILPAAAGLFLFAPSVVSLLFQHGEFNPQDTARTSAVLRHYLPGLPFAALDLILVYAFFARQDTRTPAIIGFFSLLFYIVVTLLLRDTFGLLALMLADSAKHAFHACLSAWILQRQTLALTASNWLRTLLPCLLATLITMALAAMAFALSQAALGSGKISLSVSLNLTGALAALTYFPLLRRLGITVIHDFFTHLWRRPSQRA